jgi:hypothetical protein
MTRASFVHALGLALAASVGGQGLASTYPAPGFPRATRADLDACRAVAALSTVAHNRPHDPFFTDWTLKSANGSFLTKAKVALPRGPQAEAVLDEFGTSHRSDPALKIQGRTVVFDQQIGHKPDEGEPWGLTSRWFLRRGRLYMVHFDGWGPGYPIYVGALTRGLDERPICRLATRVSLVVAAAHQSGPSAAGLCRAVQAKRVAFVRVHKLATPVRAADRDYLAGTMYRTGEVRVDAGGAGRAQTLFQYEGTSTAAGGCDLRYSDLASANDRSPLHAALMKAQDLYLKDNAYPRRTCEDASPRWFVHQGRSYLMSASKGAFDRNPRDDRGEFLTVDTVAGGRARRMCVGDYTRRSVMLTDTWDGADWRRAHR